MIIYTPILTLYIFSVCFQVRFPSTNDWFIRKPLPLSTAGQVIPLVIKWKSSFWLVINSRKSHDANVNIYERSRGILQSRVTFCQNPPFSVGFKGAFKKKNCQHLPDDVLCVRICFPFFNMHSKVFNEP